MSSNDVPFKYEDIEVSNILYKNIESNDKKTVVYLKYKKKDQIKNFVIQSPTLINKFKSINYGKYNDLIVPLIGKNDEKIKKFSQFLENLDKKFIYDARLNASSWFKKQKEKFNHQNNSKFSINYQKIIRKKEDSFPNGTIKIKLIDSTNFKTSFCHDNGSKILIDELPVNYYFKMILEINALWITDSSFGLFMKPIILSFSNPIVEISSHSYQFLEDSDEENQKESIEDVIDESKTLDSPLLNHSDRIIEKKLDLDTDII